MNACLKAVAVNGQDRMLSFLPLSHTLERTVGYYAPLVVGIAVGYARSIPQLAEDLLTVRPTILVAVPRVFERVLVLGDGRPYLAAFVVLRIAVAHSEP